MKNDVFGELLTVEGNGDNDGVRDSNFRGFDPNDGVVGFIHGFYFPSCESHCFIQAPS